MTDTWPFQGASMVMKPQSGVFLVVMAKPSISDGSGSDVGVWAQGLTSNIDKEQKFDDWRSTIVDTTQNLFVPFGWVTFNVPLLASRPQWIASNCDADLKKSDRKERKKKEKEKEDAPVERYGSIWLPVLAKDLGDSKVSPTLQRLQASKKAWPATLAREKEWAEWIVGLQSLSEFELKAAQDKLEQDST